MPSRESRILELDADPVAVAAKLIEQFGINVPVLEEDKKYAVTKETQNRCQPRSDAIYRGPFAAVFQSAETEVRIVIPFRGDALSLMCSLQCSRSIRHSARFMAMNFISSTSWHARISMSKLRPTEPSDKSTSIYRVFRGRQEQLKGEIQQLSQFLNPEAQAGTRGALFRLSLG